MHMNVTRLQLQQQLQLQWKPTTGLTCLGHRMTNHRAHKEHTQSSSVQVVGVILLLLATRSDLKGAVQHGPPDLSRESLQQHQPQLWALSMSVLTMQCC